MGDVLCCLRSGGVVLTGNARAARALGRRYGQAQRAEGKTAWPTPRIYDWEGWLGVLWNQHLLNADEAPLLLAQLQERAVWKRIVQTRSDEPESMAVLAAEAWKLLSDFNSHGELQSFWQGRASDDAEAFGKWASLFDRECRKKQWMSRSDLAFFLIPSIQQGWVELPAEILLVGFDRITPAQRALLDVSHARGCTVRETATRAEDAPAQIIRARDFRDELETCAGWLLRSLEANPDARISVIVQNIDTARGEIERIFRRILMPASAGIDHRDALPYEFSLGQPLATVPAIAAALLLLRWLALPLSRTEISWLMLSGFCSSREEDGAELALLDAEMRKYSNLPLQARLQAVASYRPRVSSPASRSFFTMLGGLDRLAEREGLERRSRSISEWLQVANRVWSHAQWPGARTLESVEFQALARWEKFTGDLAALEFDGSRVGFAEFVTLIDRYSRETIFAPESRDAPIQIMGAFESAGQQFDAVWFAGADDQQWPPAVRPHPLLPVWLQRQAAMPHSSVEADWQLAREVTRRIAASAPECIVSYAERDESGDLRASPLIRECFAPQPPLSSKEFRGRLNFPIETLHVCRTVELEDSSPMPWPRDLVAGGADILKRQSACPFQAFAVRRIGAEELRESERGLTPLDRGNILHKVLESLWSPRGSTDLALHDRRDLLNARSNQSIHRLLDDHIERVFETRRGSYEESQWDREYLRIERSRLHSLLLQWLDYEAEREDFAVVAREKDFEAAIDGLKLRLRVDRMDLISSGRLILDYKTGPVSASMWDGERPDDPQLPLYATHGGVEDLQGALFAQIRAGEVGFKGRIINDTVTVTKDPKTNSSLNKNPLDRDMLGSWRETLGNLAGQFLAGDASVTPKSFPKTCRYCALPSLCRVAETAAALEPEEDLDGDDGSESSPHE